MNYTRKKVLHTILTQIFGLSEVALKAGSRAQKLGILRTTQALVQAAIEILEDGGSLH